MYIMYDTRNMKDALQHHSYFSILPNELVLEVLSSLTLKDRLNFLKIFPRHLRLAQDTSLKTRHITCYDADLSKEELEKVLDHEGTAIELTLEYPKTVLRPILVADIFSLMPHLQEVTFRECIPDARTVPRGETLPNHWNLLTKLRVLNVDRCRCYTHLCYQASRCWLHFLQMRGVSHSADDNSLRRISYRDSISRYELASVLARAFRIASESDNEVSFQLENLRGEVMDLGAVGELPLRNRQALAEALCVTLRQQLGVDDNCLQVTVERNENGLSRLVLTEDFCCVKRMRGALMKALHRGQG